MLLSDDELVLASNNLGEPAVSFGLFIQVVPILKEKVFEFKETLPVILNLRNNMLKARHWDKVEAEIGHKVIFCTGSTTMFTLQIISHANRMFVVPY